MNHHLTDSDITGYLYQTLTDAGREAMSRHLSNCADCRTRLDSAHNFQQRIHNDLLGDLRRVQPSPQATFAALRPGLNQARRRAIWRYRGRQFLTATSGLTALALVALFFYLALPVNQFNRLKNQLLQESPIFGNQWLDPAPYQSNLISTEQARLNEMAETTIYHLSLEIAPDLSQLSGREAIRYVNHSGRTVSDLYLQLPPNNGPHQLTLSNVLLNGRPVTAQTINKAAIRLALFEPLAPAGQLVIELTFQLQLEQNRHDFGGTLGLINNILTLNNFFPIASPTIGNELVSEKTQLFIIEDTFFLAQLAAPAGVTILSSGSPIEPLNGLPTFAAGPINQFYLALSDQFTVKISTTIGQTTLNSYANGEYLRPRAEQALQAAASALTIYTNQFGPYPFSKLDLVGTSTLDIDRSSVTLPGMILISYPFSGAQGFVEQVAVNGVAQQWFTRIARQQLQQEAWFFCGLSEYSRLYYTNNDDQKAALLAEWQYLISNDIKDDMLPTTTSDNCKAAGAYHLSQLAEIIGQEKLTASLRDYYQQFQWLTPSVADFSQIVEQHCQCDLGSFFGEWQASYH